MISARLPDDSKLFDQTILCPSDVLARFVPSSDDEEEGDAEDDTNKEGDGGLSKADEGAGGHIGGINAVGDSGGGAGGDAGNVQQQQS